MKEKKLFIKSLGTLFFSWGSDAPAEVYWGANEMLDWYEKEYVVKLNIRFNEEEYNFDEVIQAIENC